MYACCGHPIQAFLCVLAAPRLAFHHPNENESCALAPTCRSRPVLRCRAVPPKARRQADGGPLQEQRTRVREGASHSSARLLPLQLRRRGSSIAHRAVQRHGGEAGSAAAASQARLTLHGTPLSLCAARPKQRGGSGSGRTQAAWRTPERSPRRTRRTRRDGAGAGRVPSSFSTRGLSRVAALTRFFEGRCPSVTRSAAHGAAGSARVLPAGGAHEALRPHLTSGSGRNSRAAAKRAQRAAAAAAAADPRAAAPERRRSRMKPPAPAPPRRHAAWPPGERVRTRHALPPPRSVNSGCSLRWRVLCVGAALPGRAPLRRALHVHHCTTARRTRSERCGGSEGAQKGGR
jgi:hypothetical protein